MTIQAISRLWPSSGRQAHSRGRFSRISFLTLSSQTITARPFWRGSIGELEIEDGLTKPDDTEIETAIAAGTAAMRRAGPADAAAVRALTRAAYAKWVPVIGREPRPMTADYEPAVRDHLVDLLQADGELVGLVEMAPAADHLLVVNVAVAPGAQGKGFGRFLMAHAEKIAASLGAAEILLYTNGRFAENIRLYRRLGYRIDREEVHPQFGETVYMSKVVHSEPR